MRVVQVVSHQFLKMELYVYIYMYVCNFFPLKTGINAILQMKPLCSESDPESPNHPLSTLSLFNLKVSQQSLPAVLSVCDLSKHYCGISASCEDLGVCFWILQVTPTAKLLSILTPFSCFSHNNKSG